MQFAIHFAIFAYLATPAFCDPTVPSVWLYWDDNGKEAYTPGGNEGWRLDSGCHEELIDYDGIWIEKDPRPREREGCAYAYEESSCCGRFESIELAFSGDGETRAVFADAGLSFAGKSFWFSNVSYSSGVAEIN